MKQNQKPVFENMKPGDPKTENGLKCNPQFIFTKSDEQDEAYKSIKMCYTKSTKTVILDVISEKYWF